MDVNVDFQGGNVRLALLRFLRGFGSELSVVYFKNSARFKLLPEAKGADEFRGGPGPSLRPMKKRFRFYSPAGGRGSFILG